MSISISTNIVFPMSPLFFEIMSLYFSHNLSNAFCVFGDMFLSSSTSCVLVLPLVTSDSRRPFSQMGSRRTHLVFPVVSWMVSNSKTSPSLESFSVKAMTWSFGRCRCLWWLKFTMTNGVTASGCLSFRSAIMGYVHMLGFALNHSWSGITSTLISSMLLMSTSTTAQDRGGTLMFLFRDTEALDGDWYSVVSAMTSLFGVS